MSDLFNDLKVLKSAEAFSDRVWKLAITWNFLAKDTVGKQLIRAADSIGANIAEAFGRYHYGEKIKFLYYARGSLFEVKFWLNRGVERKLISPKEFKTMTQEIESILRQLNSFIRYIKQLKSSRN